MEPKRFVRCESKYVNNGERFVLKEKHFKRQYAHIYASRLWTMRARVEEAARKRWGAADDVPVRKLSELATDERCILVGTLFKHMQLKPSILKEIGEDHDVTAQPIRTKYVDPTDQLILEDELQRIILVGDVNVQEEVTGAVVAICGQESGDDPGKFRVERMIFQELPEQDAPFPVLDDDKFIVFLSGLEIGHSTHSMLHVQLLIELLTGQLGDEETQRSMSRVTRLVVAGNSLSRLTQDREQANRAKYLAKKTTVGTKEAVCALDDVLVQLCACMEVDLMPGEFDPTTFTLPQQPLHRLMFPRASRYATMHCVTNPYDFAVDGVRIVGTSGQPVDDIYRFSSLEDHLEILEKTLRMGHLAPTAPDTLGCYPYADRDPFILDVLPNVYFSGNADGFKEKIFQGANGQRALLLTVPRFRETLMCVMVNVRNLSCRPIVVGSRSVLQQKN